MNKTLEEIAVITYGKDYKKNPPGDNIPIYGTGGIMGYTSKPLNSGPSVLTGRKGSINKPFYVDGDFWNVDTIYCIKTTPIINTKWFYYNLCNKNLSILNEATGVPSVSTSALNKLQFHYVDFPHQRKIARILTTVDSIIEKTEAAIAKYKAIKQGMMHDLFTRGIDVKTGKLRPKFEDAPELYKESELGWIPKEWEVKRLDELSKQIGDGIHATPKYSVNTGLYFINGNNLDDGKISIFESTLCVDKDEYKRHYLALDENTLLYSINGTIGNIAIYRGEKVILGKSAAYIICRNKKLLKYLYHYLQTIFVDSFYENEMTGSTIKNLSLTSIRKTPIRIPKNENEQNFISEKITSLASKIEYELEFLDKYQKIKSGLMQDLLTGKKEVTPDPEDYKEMEI